MNQLAQLELVVLGSSAAAPAAGDACSGYLVRWGSTRLLLDCGSGTLSRLLLEGVEPASLSAIAVSHFHPDHYLDLITMRYALRYGSKEPVKPRLLVPPYGRHFLARLGDALRCNPALFDGSFRIEEYDSRSRCRIGDLELSFCRTTHDEPSWAIGVDAPNGTRLVYSSDTRVCPALESFAMNASALLCESTYPAQSGDLPSDNHLTSAEAGQLARRAGVGQLILTHFWPAYPRECFAREAEATFGRPVTVACAGLKVALRA
jgi:ribonuclease BN (tRNA processing enzyme)